ncbi:MAG: hypothetical protein QG620_409 [Patescibacteria group bacterium]|nr:hypothetical protein [Patescibacteria group bacterium]
MKTYCLVIIGVFLLLPFKIRGESYDVYVNKNYIGEEDGSRERPFRSIAKALEFSPSGKIFIYAGLYEESVILKDSAELFGESRKEVALNGALTMEGKNLVKDITVEGGNIAIDVAKGAKAAVENCIVKKSRSIGINVAAGKGKITVKKTDLYDNERKAMYIQAGNEVEIEDSNIFDNGEEGIDIRAGVIGSVRGNKIYGNKESGIEFIVGSSELEISGNTIRNNRASGIAAQFYQESNRAGKIRIAENQISGNNNYGFTCALPSGGEPTFWYWKDSINLENNTIEANGTDPINAFCHIAEAVDDNENTDNAITDQPVENRQEDAHLLMLGEENRPIEVDITQEKADKEKALAERADEIEFLFKESSRRATADLENLTKRNKLALFLFGVGEYPTGIMKKEIEKDSVWLKEVKDLLSQSELEEQRQSLTALSQEIENKIKYYENILGKEISRTALVRKLAFLWVFLL